MDIRNAEVRQLGVEQNSVNDERETVQVGDRPDSNGCSEEYVARRLTPTECARLQGFPPDWCSDVPHSDSAEYKLWGNGIALPCLFNLFKSIVDVYEAEALDEPEESRLQADTILTEEVRDASDK